VTRIADLIAVDPGDSHTGVAFFNRGDDGVWYCFQTIEFEPDEFNDAWLGTLVAREEPEFLILEIFRLYADLAAEQRGSEFLTSQQIGALKFITRKHNEHAQAHLDAVEMQKMTTCEVAGGVCSNPQVILPSLVTLEMQQADIQKPTAGILRHNGIKSTAKKTRTGAHCLSAELHGWYYILKTREWEGRSA